MASVQSNMVAVGTKGTGMDEYEFSSFLKSIGILANASLPYTVRMVTHHDVNSQDIDEAVSRIRAAIKK